jgi:hypothetical protein
MKASTRALVRSRAARRCEYCCHLENDLPLFSFHIIVVLFNPRRQRWHRHFEWDGPRLVGLTPSGRATIAVFNINAAHRIDLRELLIQAGLFPPD